MVLARDSELTEGWAHRPDSNVYSMGQIGGEKLAGICDRLGLADSQRERAQRLFRRLSQSWSARPVTAYALWPSDITDDGTPFEFSLAFSEAQPKLRFLVESQVTSISEHSTWDAARELNARLEEDGLANLSRFAKIEDLFTPRAQCPARFSLWHASVLQASGDVLIKVYLNPAIHGEHRSRELVRSALLRLGHEASWDFLERRLRDEQSRIVYFSLDLDSGSSARIKVYVGRQDSAEGIERLIAGDEKGEAGQAVRWIEGLAGRTKGFDSRPLLACFAFTDPARPPRATVHVPVRCYQENDAASVRAISAFLSQENAATLESVTRYLAHLPLELSHGVITYASLRAGPTGATETTVYLAPQLYALGPAR
jgi:tryptophan dimethylallyltransferase